MIEYRVIFPRTRRAISKAEGTASADIANPDGVILSEGNGPRADEERMTPSVIPRGRGGGWARNPPPTERASIFGWGFLAHPRHRPLGMTAFPSLRMTHG